MARMMSELLVAVLAPRGNACDCLGGRWSRLAHIGHRLVWRAPELMHEPRPGS